MSFESLGLSPFLLRALAEQGYTHPTPIQTQAIPLALEGHDLLAGAQTGTGKTAAFGLPLLQTPGHHATIGERAAPSTRADPGAHPRTGCAGARKPARLQQVPAHSSTTIYGGVGMGPQLDALRRWRGPGDRLPRRLIDHMERRSVDLSGLEILVLDEADRMLDMGFMPAIKRILPSCPSRTADPGCFSATFEESIKQLALEFMHNPQQIQVTPKKHRGRDHQPSRHPVDGTRKRETAAAPAGRRHAQPGAGVRPHQTWLRQADQVPGTVRHQGRGDPRQQEPRRPHPRAEGLQGRPHQCAVATDIAARGIDIDQLPKVINFDCRWWAEDYVHRIGRTGRNGSQGEAISQVAQDESQAAARDHPHAQDRC